MSDENDYLTSIILVTWNRLDLTKRMMESFWKTTDTPFRLFIVDNGSKDGTVEWLQQFKSGSKWCQGVETHFFDHNRGLAMGRNKGLLMAKQYQHNWLATIDNDLEMPQSWLKKCIDVMKKNPMYSVGVNYEGVKYPLLTKNGITFQFKSKGNIGGGTTVFSKVLHDRIGFYSIEHFFYGEDDSDFGQRQRLAGYNLAYIEEMGNHFGGEFELDTGEYREFKDQCRKNNLAKFQKDCYDYAAGRKSIYHPYIERQERPDEIKLKDANKIK